MLARTLNGFRVSRLVGIALMALAAFALAGCGGVEGTYVSEEKSPDGEIMSMSLELKGDDKAVMTMKGGPDGEAISMEGTYSVEGDKVTVVLAGDSDVFTLKDNTLTMNSFGETIVLRKK